MAKSPWLRIQSVNHVFALTLTGLVSAVMENVVTRDVNLRPDSSTSGTPIDKLTPQTQVGNQAQGDRVITLLGANRRLKRSLAFRTIGDW